MTNTTKRKVRLKPTSKLSGHEQVVEFMNAIDHPLKKSMEAVREIILGSHKGITEHIKWNAPSFCFNGDDRVTFNLHKNEYILLIFHRGSKAKTSIGNSPLFKDSTGLLEWVANDRATVKLHSIQDVKTKKDLLKKVVNKWIRLTSD